MLFHSPINSEKISTLTADFLRFKQQLPLHFFLPKSELTEICETEVKDAPVHLITLEIFSISTIHLNIAISSINDIFRRNTFKRIVKNHR